MFTKSVGVCKHFWPFTSLSDGEYPGRPKGPNLRFKNNSFFAFDFFL